MNFAPPYQTAKEAQWQLLKSLAIPRSVLVQCHECWQMNAKTQGQHSPLTYAPI